MHQHTTHVSDLSAKPQDNSRYIATRNVTLMGAVTNFFLSIAQLAGGFFTHSQALVADGLHTLSDLASDFVVLAAAKMASKDADDEHPYGHGRIETVATIILALGLMSIAGGIIYSASNRILHPEKLMQPSVYALFFAALAIVSKEALYHFTQRVAKRINSPMLHANAWHHRSDAISSVVVLLGIGGAILFGIKWLDSAAAIVVGLMILYMGVQMLKESVLELVDTALDPERVAEISSFIDNIDGVESVHMLRTRKMGGQALADVHVQVDSHISVSEGHHIAERVMWSLKHSFDELEDITVHIDPEDDENSSPSRKLPSRQKVLGALQPLLEKTDLLSGDNIINFHYLNGEIHIHICLHKPLPEAGIKQIKECFLGYPGITSVHVFIAQQVS